MSEYIVNQLDQHGEFIEHEYGIRLPDGEIVPYLRLDYAERDAPSLGGTVVERDVVYVKHVYPWET